MEQTGTPVPQESNPPAPQESKSPAPKESKSPVKKLTSLPSRWMERLPDSGFFSRASVITVILSLLLLGGVEASIYATWGSKFLPSAYLPTGPAVYVQLDQPWNREALGHVFDSDFFAWLAQREDGKGLLMDLRAAYVAMTGYQFRSTTGKAARTIFGLEPTFVLGAKTGIAVYGIKNGDPVFVAAFPRVLVTRVAGLTKLFSFLPSDWVVTRELAGNASSPVWLHTITTPAGRKLYVRERADAVVIGNDYDRVLGELLIPLCDDGEMLNALRKVSASPVKAIFAPKEFMKLILAFNKEGDAIGTAWKYFDKVFNGFFFSGLAYKWLALGADFDQTEGTIRSLVSVAGSLDEERTEKGRGNNLEIKDFTAVGMLPADTFVALSWVKDVPLMWQSILKEQTPEELEKIKADPASQVFEEKFFPAMSKVHALALVPQKLSPETAKKFPFPSLVLLLGLKDEKTFSTIVYDEVDAFMEDLEKKQKSSGEPMPFFARRKTYQKVEIEYFEIPNNPVMNAIQPAFAFVDNFWVISSSVEGIEKIIDARKGVSSLASSQVWYKAARAVELPISGWLYVDPVQTAAEFNTNATVWNENLLKIRPDDILITELRYRPREQALYNNEIRAEQFKRKKGLDLLSTALYNARPFLAVYREFRSDVDWRFSLSVQ
ncbi:MAG: DUF3352 domain-containing protein [Candidatus Brocadiia bacterium]